MQNKPDDAEIVEITASSAGSDRLLERDEHAGNVVPVPNRPEQTVGEPVRAHECYKNMKK